MNRAGILRRAAPSIALAVASLVASVAWMGAAGQQPSQPQPQAPQTPRAAAPIDLTGYWVSVVTEDWRWRMLTPPKGDYTSIPLNNEGRRVGDTWDPAKAASDGCKPFGAAAIMRMPGRAHVTWEGDNILKIETDAGQQTRMLRFDPSTLRPFDELRVVPSSVEGRQAQGRPELSRRVTGSGPSRAESRDDKPAGERTWQGHSVAEWQIVGGGRGARGAAPQPRDGSLKVTTTNMRAGFYRRNGVPYSEDAVMTEYFDRHAAYGTEWLTVTTIVEDPKYLTQSFITSTHFKKEPNASKWNPTPCE